MCSLVYFNWLLTHFMYKTQSKAKLTVIDIINPIKRKANISNIDLTSSLLIRNQGRGITNASAFCHFLCGRLYNIFKEMSIQFAKNSQIKMNVLSQ